MRGVPLRNRVRSAHRMRRLLITLLWTLSVAASAAEVDVYIFWRAGCPHCDHANAFLSGLAANDPALRVHGFEVSRNREHLNLMVRVSEALGVTSGSVPFTVIGDQVWVGYRDDASTGRELAQRIEQCLKQSCPDVVAPLRHTESAPHGRTSPSSAQLPKSLYVPWLGEIRTSTMSLPLLTMLLAAIDGFNPCALWVLVFLLALLAGVKDRARMWMLGGAFVAVSALVYLLILGAWLNVLIFLGAVLWFRIGVGVAAIACGSYYLRAYFEDADPVCKVTAPERRQRIFARLRELTQQHSVLVALCGIVLLAFAVNLVEFFCSAGIPAVFTQLLALSSLSMWEYAAYLMLYVFVFMLDDLIVLVVALRTFEITGLTVRYARWSNLIGGGVLVMIGALLIFKPQWLTFT